jgi:hypothetical protein
MLIEVIDGAVHVNGDRIDRIHNVPSTNAAALREIMDEYLAR